MSFRARPHQLHTKFSLSLGACAMTTIFLNNIICTFQILLSWRFSQKKKRVLDDFPLCPLCPPLKTANFIFIGVSPSCFLASVISRRAVDFTWKQCNSVGQWKKTARSGWLCEFLSPDFPEISGIQWNLGEFGEIREISGKFRAIQWNSVGFCMALSMNSVGIPGGFRGNAGSSGKFRVSGGFGWFGGSKGFCANSQRGGLDMHAQNARWSGGLHQPQGSHVEMPSLSWPPPSSCPTYQKAADVWKKDVWEFQAVSQTFLELRFSLGNEGKGGKNLNSQTWPGTPRRPSPRHPRPPELTLSCHILLLHTPLRAP